MNSTQDESETLMDTKGNPSIIVSMQVEKNQSKKKNLCTPCLVANHEMEENPSFWTKLKFSLLCPPHGWLADWVTYALLVVTLWGVAYVMFGSIATPGSEKIVTEFKQGAFFSILVVVTLSLVGGWVVSLVGSYLIR